MSKLGIGTGITPDDGNGDSLLDGAVKINSNFDEIYSYFGDGSDLSGSWQKVSSGINTTLNVGIGTTNPRFILEVGAVGSSGTTLYVNGDARITGILTVGSSSITLDGSSNTINVGSGVTIDGGSGTISANTVTIGGETLVGSGVTLITAGSGIYVDQSTGNVTISATEESHWTENEVGIHTLSNVGIGTTNPTSALTVNGNTFLESLNVSGLATAANLKSIGNLFVGNSGYYIREDTSNNIEYYFGSTGKTVHHWIGTNSQFIIRNPSKSAGSNEIAFFKEGGAVELYYNASKKFETTSGGVTITGNINATSFSGSGSGLTGVLKNLVEDTSPQLGGVLDLNGKNVSGIGTIFVQGTVGGIYGLRTGDNVTGNHDALKVRWGPGRSEDFRIRTITNLIDNNIYNPTTPGIEFATSYADTNIYVRQYDGPNFTSVTKELTLLNTSGNTIINNSLGIGTTNPTEKLTVRGNVSLGDNDKILLGNDGDFEIYSDASGNTIFKNSTSNTGGDIYIQSDSILIKKYDGSQTIAEFTEGAGVELNYNGQNRLATVSTGVIVGSNSAGVAHIPTELRIGSISSNQSDATILIANSSGVGIATTNPTSKLTVSGDVNVSGAITATAFVGDGSGLTGVNAVGTGISVFDSSSLIGVATAIDFGDNLSVSAVSAGLVTVTATGGGGGGESYWTQTDVGIHTLSSVGIATTNPQTPLQVENVYGIKTGSGTFTASTGVAHTADSYTVSDFVNAEYTLFFQHSSGIQSQKVLVMDDGTTAYSQEYGIMSSNDILVSVGATVKSGNVELWWTPETGVSGVVTYRYTRETMI